MTKNEFLKDLEQKLSSLSKSDRDKTLSYYQELIDDQLENQIPEEKIFSELNSPQKIADELLSELKEKSDNKSNNEYALNENNQKNEEKTNFFNEKYQKCKNYLKKKQYSPYVWIAIILGFPLWFSLLVAAFSIVFSVVVAIFSVFISFWAVAVSLIASSFAVGIAGLAQVVASPFYFPISTPYGFSLIGLGLVAIGISIVMYYFSIWLFKVCYQLSILTFKAITKIFKKKEIKQNV